MIGKRKLKTAIHAFNAIKDASTRFGVGYPALIGRFLYLYRSRRFSPHEIDFNDLLNPVIRDEVLDHYLSKERMLALDDRHLLDAYLCLTSDKSIFYSVCGAAGIPTPRLFAVFDLPAGWSPDGRLLRSRAEWCQFLDSLPPDFVVKPALGLLGKGVRVFRRDASGFVDGEGHRRTVDELYDLLCGVRDLNLLTTNYSHHSVDLPQGTHKTIVQERLSAHPALVDLNGSQTLCTCRLFTYSDAAGKAHILGTAMRLAGGRMLVDNFDQGASGNLWCSVDADTGCIVEAFVRRAGCNRLERVSDHPVTGRHIIGFHVPDWDRVLALAQHLAATFRPQTLITWDIGVAANGPIAIEGNTGGNLLPTPLNQSLGPHFTDALL